MKVLNFLHTIFRLIGQFFLDVPFWAFEFAMFLSSFVGFKKDKDGERASMPKDT
jgi:hypothetical protein